MIKRERGADDVSVAQIGRPLLRLSTAHGERDLDEIYAEGRPKPYNDHSNVALATCLQLACIRTMAMMTKNVVTDYVKFKDFHFDHAVQLE